MKRVPDTWSVRKVKTFLGSEGHGFNAELLRNGQPVAFVIDGAQGGNYAWEWYGKYHAVEIHSLSYQDEPFTYEGHPEEKLFVEYAHSQTYECKYLGRTTHKSADMYMAELVDAHQINKRFRTLSKKRTLFRLKGEAEGAWSSLKQPYSATSKEYLEKTYKDKLEVVYDPAVGL